MNWCLLRTVRGNSGRVGLSECIGELGVEIKRTHAPSIY